MNVTNWRVTAVAIVVLAGIGLFAFAVERPSGVEGERGFLAENQAYVIRFTDGSNIFKSTTSGVTTTSYETEDGEKHAGGPATWSVTLTVKTFRVVRLSNSPWVLLEHPINPDDIDGWERQCRARAILASAQAKAIKEKPDGREQLDKLEEDAKAKIATIETWVNLNHAVAVCDVPFVDESNTPTITSAKIKP